MNIISHAFLGIIIIKFLSIIRPDNFYFNLSFISLAIFFSILPDLESLWSKSNINDHHSTPFHSPFFWILITFILLIIGIPYNLLSLEIILLFFISTESHLISDYITGRFTGIKIFDPINKKEYSLKKINKENGKVRPIHLHKKEFRNVTKYYFKDKSLIIFESLIWVLGIISIL